MFLWMPPDGKRAGDILLADSTIFTTLFGGDESLERFWKNIVTVRCGGRRHVALSLLTLICLLLHSTHPQAQSRGYTPWG